MYLTSFFICFVGNMNPKIVLLISGKRKSGKDYICEKIKKYLGDEKCTIVRISGPLKRLYAENHQLDLNELLSDSPYKEIYRREMIVWSDKIRETEPGYFCKAACLEAQLTPVWIVSDIRRKTDIIWFENEYRDKIKKIRVLANTSTRQNRGWVYTKGVDDVASECNLDDYSDWDFQITNDVDAETQSDIEKILSEVKKTIV